MTAQIAAYGRLVADPQLKTTSKGTQMATASMAVPLVNATMFDRYLPFSCPLNTFVTDAVRFPPFHHH